MKCMLRDTYTNECVIFPLMSVVCIGWMKSKRNEEKWGLSRVVCYLPYYSGPLVAQCDEAGWNDETNTIDRTTMCVSSKRFFSSEHLKQVWLETFTTKQKGAHSQTFWSYVHNASISRLVSAHIFVCSVRFDEFQRFIEFTTNFEKVISTEFYESATKFIRRFKQKFTFGFCVLIYFFIFKWKLVLIFLKINVHFY